MSVNSKMTAIANAIRGKTGKTGTLTLDDMARDIAAIDTSEDLDEVLDEQDSIIEQIQIALEGKAVKPEQTKTATPSLSQQTISPDSGYTLGGVTVEPITADLLTSLDPDFKPENIAGGINLFGMDGTRPAGAKVATGQITSSSYTLTVTGLNFKPEHVVLIKISGYETGVLLYDYDTSGKYYASGSNKSQICTHTLTDNGFTAVGAGINTSVAGFSGSYYWIAWAE